MSSPEAPAQEGVRVDIWLWAARFFKTRALAKQALQASRVQVNEQDAKPSRLIRVGDRVRVVRGGETYLIEVRGLSERRGPAPQAQALYEEGEESVAARAAEREQRRLADASVLRPAGKPDKHARRKIREVNQNRDRDLPPWFPK